MKLLLKRNENKIIYIIIGILIFWRIAMMLRTPLFAIANGQVDDQLLVRLADYLQAGNWLGSYNWLTLVKGLSFSAFLALTNRVGIPYLLAEGTAYVFAIFALLAASRKVLKNKWIRLAAFAFLLFSPSMLSTYTEQRAYNMALIPMAVIFVAAGCLGMYFHCCEKGVEFYFWAVLEVLSFVFFWHLRNESIWYLPFTAAAMAICIFCMIRRKNIGIKVLLLRSAFCLLPFVALWGSNQLIASKNEMTYGLRIVNDRSQGASAKFMSLLLSIDQEKSIEAMGSAYTYKSTVDSYGENVWVPREVIELAMANSPTFESVREDVVRKYEVNWNSLASGANYVIGDSFIWAIRDALSDAGYYHNNAVETEAFYEKMVEELQEAFDNGKLIRDDKVHLSALAKGFDAEDVPEIMEKVKDSLLSLFDARYTYVGMRDATGSEEEIRYFESMTGALAEYGMMGETHFADSEITYADLTIKRSNKILLLYQKTGMIRIALSMIAFLILTVRMVQKIRKKDYFLLGEWIIVLGWIGSLLLFVTAVVAFSSFLGAVPVFYHYLTPGLVLLDMMEVFLLFGGLNQIIDFWNSRNHKK